MAHIDAKWCHLAVTMQLTVSSGSSEEKEAVLNRRFKRYASKSLKEVTEAFVSLTEAEGKTEEAIELARYLKVRLLRNVQNAHAFHAYGGLAALLGLLQPLTACREKTSELTLLLGALGNLCSLDKDCRSMVRLLCKQFCHAVMYAPLPNT